jgi:two-component system, NarL family, response regulator DevR
VLAGASGYVRKEVRAANLVDAIRQAAMGRSLIDPGLIAKVMQSAREMSPADQQLASLTDREREVLDLIAQGLTNKQIGERMFLSDKTVKNYVSSLLGKLGMERRTQAAVFAAELHKDPRAT